MAFADDWRTNPQYQQAQQRYAPLVAQAVAAHNLPPEAADYIQGTLGVESRWGLAKGLSTPGAAGELGIAQLTPGFRQDYGVQNPLDDSQAINAIARYYAQQSQKGVPLEYIPIGYNAGTGTLNNFLSGKRSFENLPEITQNYVNRLRQFTGNGSASSTGLANYSTPVASTLQKFGLSASRPTQAAPAFGEALFGGASDGSFGQALFGGGGGQGGRTPAVSSTGWEKDYSTQSIPTFSANASLESINRLLQGV